MANGCRARRGGGGFSRAGLAFGAVPGGLHALFGEDVRVDDVDGRIGERLSAVLRALSERKDTRVEPWLAAAMTDCDIQVRLAAVAGMDVGGALSACGWPR